LWSSQGAGPLPVSVTSSWLSRIRIPHRIGRDTERGRKTCICFNTFNYGSRRKPNCIGPDNRKAMRLLTNHLIDLGHCRFGVIAQSIQNNDRAAGRLNGIKDALSEAGLILKPAHFAEGRSAIAEGRALFAGIIVRKPRPTAIIRGNA